MKSKNRNSLSARLTMMTLAVAPALQWMTLFGTLVPGDLGVLPFTGIGVAVRDRRDWNQNRLRRELRLPALCIVLGSILALWDLGPVGWALKTLFQDLVVTMTFLGLLAYARKRALDPAYLARWVAITLIVISVVEVMSGGYRPTATLGQPNITGHFFVCALLFCLPKLRRRWWLMLPLVVVAVGRTGSFGALVSLPIAFAYLGFGAIRRRMRDASSIRVFTSWLLVLAPLGVLAALTFGAVAGDAAEKGASLGNDRLSSSSEGRTIIWKEGIEAWQGDPLGLGPHGFKELRIDWRFGQQIADASEIHNDMLGYLVERGPLGLFGLLLLYRVLWAAGAKGGVARALLIANAIGGMTHETLHFRVLWVLLALALASELHDRPQRQPRTRYARRRARLEAAERAALELTTAENSVTERPAQLLEFSRG